MINIRSLRKDDRLDDLIALSRIFFAEYEVYHADFFKIDELKDEQVIGYFRSFCSSEQRKAYIAMDGGHVVGYITVYIRHQADYWKFKKVGEISGLLVRKDYRHQGIALELLDQAKLFFAAQGVKYYTVYSAVANQAGLNFYEKNGLKPLYTTLIGVTPEK